MYIVYFGVHNNIDLAAFNKNIETHNTAWSLESSNYSKPSCGYWGTSHTWWNDNNMTVLSMWPVQEPYLRDMVFVWGQQASLWCWKGYFWQFFRVISTGICVLEASRSWVLVDTLLKDILSWYWIDTSVDTQLILDWHLGHLETTYFCRHAM